MPNLLKHSIFLLAVLIHLSTQTACAQDSPKNLHQAERIADWLTSTWPATLRLDVLPRLSKEEIRKLGKIEIRVIRPPDRTYCRDSRQPGFSERRAEGSLIYLCARSIYYIVDLATASAYMSAVKDKREFFDQAFIPYLLFNARNAALDNESTEAEPNAWCHPTIFMYLAVNGLSSFDCGRPDAKRAESAGSWLEKSLDKNGPVPWDTKLLGEFSADYARSILLAIVSHELAHLLNDEPQEEITPAASQQLEIDADLRAFKTISRNLGELSSTVVVPAFMTTLAFISATSANCTKLNINQNTLQRRVRASAQYTTLVWNAVQTKFSAADRRLFEQVATNAGFDPKTFDKKLLDVVR